MRMQVQQQRPQRVANGARVAHQLADGAQVFEDKPFADKKADVVATRERFGRREQPAERLEGDPAIRVAKCSEFDGRAREGPTRGYAKFGKYFGECGDRADTDIVGGGGCD